jgi:hypothetical protein
MQNFLKRLLVLLTVLIALPSFCPTQLREVRTGAPGPVNAPHLSAELISDSGTISPRGQDSRRLGSDAGAWLACSLGVRRGFRRDDWDT